MIKQMFPERENSHTFGRNVLVAVATVIAIFAVTGIMAAQDAAVAVPSLQLQIAPQDKAAAVTVSNFRFHALGANTAAAKALPKAMFTGGRPALKAPLAAATVPAVPAPGFYPSDLSYFGGHFLTSMQSHALTVNCGFNCFGQPNKFLSDLGQSTFIHVVDQYVGTTADNRYTVGKSASFSETIFGNTLSQSDLFALIHAGAAAMGTGYGHMYHLFLAPGIDTCFDLTNICYSPDNPSSFFFCAYHGSLDFSDIGHVIFSIEPSQNVPGCQVPKPAPNGILADSTNSTLSHEMIEAITDPDLDAWFTFSSLDTAGAEIGDLCQPIAFVVGFPNSVLNGKNYKIQLEYSNTYHACANVP